MPRHPRDDFPDQWHHLMNRGLAKRTLFESEDDLRYFLSRLAREVRARRLELHAFCVLTTHFHLLVRSPEGELSAAMQHMQNEYARWFNRTRRRDGPLYRGRFVSKPVESLAYRELLVRYIDANPVSAGLVTSAELYPHGSARWYAANRGPIWLERSWVERTVCRHAGIERYDPRRYAELFGPRDSKRSAELVERRLLRPGLEPDPLDELLHAAAGETRAWMQRKAALADGTTIGLPVCDEESVCAVVEEARARVGSWKVRGERKLVDAWPVATIGLLRELCGSTLADVGARTARTASNAWKLEGRHRRWMQEDEPYATRIGELAREAMVRCHPGVGVVR
ncbi:MAG: transposase [Planctomycetes bacterium]|nr:transposase [Planctomycetota bacterium]